MRIAYDIWQTTALPARHPAVLDTDERIIAPETMDRLDLESHLHHSALKGLSRINFWSGSAGMLWPPLAALARRLDRPIRVLDVATGGGDVPIRLWQRANRSGIQLELTAGDRSLTALDVAGQNAGRVSASVRFLHTDVLSDQLPSGQDVVICSLFLHHLLENDAVRLLAKMGVAAEHLVLVNDLRRCRVGLVLAHLACRLLTRSPVVHEDGPLSVKAAFTPQEALALAERAGLTGASIAKKWPCRMLLTWKRPERWDGP
jgi:2-polyprenyl-3-methyl-5-hydroxy-6-metoxy-1,4-benzoquinol methylase